MFRGPFCGEAVQRALGVVLLIGDHPSDTNDKIVETFGCRPKIADTHRGIIEIRVKDRRQHPTLRRAPRIIERQVDL